MKINKFNHRLMSSIQLNIFGCIFRAEKYKNDDIKYILFKDAPIAKLFGYYLFLYKAKK